MKRGIGIYGYTNVLKQPFFVFINTDLLSIMYVPIQRYTCALNGGCVCYKNPLEVFRTATSARVAKTRNRISVFYLIHTECILFRAQVFKCNLYNRMTWTR